MYLLRIWKLVEITISMILTTTTTTKPLLTIIDCYHGLNIVMFSEMYVIVYTRSVVRNDHRGKM